MARQRFDSHLAHLSIITAEGRWDTSSSGAFRDTRVFSPTRRVSQRKHISPPIQETIQLGNNGIRYDLSDNASYILVTTSGHPSLGEPMTRRNDSVPTSPQRQEAAGVPTAQKLERENRPLHRTVASPGGPTSFSISQDADYPPPAERSPPTSPIYARQPIINYRYGNPVNDSHTRFYGGRALVRKQKDIGGEDHVNDLWGERVMYNESIQEAQRREAYDPTLSEYAARAQAAGTKAKERQRTVRQLQSPGGGNTTIQLDTAVPPGSHDYESSLAEAQYRAALLEEAKSGSGMSSPERSQSTTPRYQEVGGRSAEYLDKVSHADHTRYPRETSKQPVGGRGYYFDGEYFQPPTSRENA
eukprot:gb/GECG01006047.1/.p1 GENE.gb/GECG01006047.1/~~gb/GECG01006047.1/.p1  ORF type:complete len:358 (+),score=37.49 gb/GECG01006047.1/:1-1074(+)